MIGLKHLFVAQTIIYILEGERLFERWLDRNSSYVSVPGLLMRLIKFCPKDALGLTAIEVIFLTKHFSTSS